MFLINCVSVGKSFMAKFFGRFVGFGRIVYGWNIFSIELFNYVFVGIFGRFFGRFLGLERIGFIRHICCVLREEGTKNFFSVREEEQEK